MTNQSVFTDALGQRARRNFDLVLRVCDRDLEVVVDTPAELGLANESGTGRPSKIDRGQAP